MPTDHLDAVSQRFDFADWKGINRLDRELSLRNITLPKDLVSGLDPARIREIDPGDGSRLLRVSWPIPGQEAAVLVMDIRECESREAAHQVLLELLANMQAPDVKRLVDNAPGDIAFGRDSTTAVVFARGNIAVSISNGGHTIVPVDETAKTVDLWIMDPHD